MRKPTPKSVVLDLLRVTPRSLSLPVSLLVRVGDLFGFQGNAVRVAVARLVASSLVASDERGSYHLASKADPVGAWVERWRLGDTRTRAWSGDWLGALAIGASTIGERRRTEIALTRLGFRLDFRLGPGKLWIRPANLRADLAELRDTISGLGAIGIELVGVQEPSEALEARWRTTLWASSKRLRSYREAQRQIERSRERLPRSSERAGLLESFVVGGNAIRLLSSDPLLPEEIESGELRRQLTASMLDYDGRGRALWTRTLAARPSRSPRHLPIEGVHA